MWPDLFVLPYLEVPVKTYGLLIAVAFLVAVWTASRRAAWMGIDPALISDLAFWMVVAGVAGARLFYVAQYWEAFRARPLDAFKIWQGGLVFYGGFGAGMAAGFAFVRRRNLSPWEIADCVSPSVMLGYAIGRIGCFVNGCCWGFLTAPDAWFGVAFPAVSGAGGGFQPIFLEHLRRGLVFHGDDHALPVFPAQGVGVAAGLLLSALLAWRLRRRRYPGQVFFWMLGGYAAYRFAAEFLRDDTPRAWAAGAFPGLTISQGVSAGVLAGAALWARHVSRRFFP